jgi:hypothetical protein
MTRVSFGASTLVFVLLLATSRNAEAQQPLPELSFEERGGGAGMVMDGEWVRLEINLPVATRAHLTISSRLFSMTHVIYEPTNAGRKYST